MTSLLLALLLATTSAPASQPTTREIEESRKRYMRQLVLPGAILGGVVIVTVIVVGNRVRQRKLERGELPEMPEDTEK